jgi:hypothetical protein
LNRTIPALVCVCHDSDFQQIQGSQQIGILDCPLGRSNTWLTSAIDGFYFVLNELDLLASLNRLEKIRLHEAVGERNRGRRWTGATLSQLGPTS